MAQKNITSESSSAISHVQSGCRAVLYEELAEYYYLFSRKKALESASIQSEVSYHIGNIVLLTLYFDIVFIQTASIFNSSDTFIREVTKGVLRNNKFKEMLGQGAVRIIGWGGGNPKEMFQAAKGFSIQARPETRDEEYYSVIASVFSPQNVVTRSDSTPDYGMESLFRKRLEQTTIIRNRTEHSQVDNAVDISLENTGQFVAVSFNPEIGKLKLSSSSLTAVENSFIQSWYDHLESEIPGVVTYAPATSAVFLNQKVVLGEKEIRTFLYSPHIFASFLNGYLSVADFNKILRHPFSKLVTLKNGDWGRFCDAYHNAIAVLSDNIGHLSHADINEKSIQDASQWASKLASVISNKNKDIDVNAFLESVALLSGVVLSIPCIGPIAKLAGNITGKRVNELFNAIRYKATTETSPFILKLMKHYELSGARA